MAINKIVLRGQSLIDLSADTVNENNVMKGVRFHKANGEIAEGQFENGVVSVDIVYNTGTVHYVASDSQLKTFIGTGTIETVSPSMIHMSNTDPHMGGDGGVTSTQSNNIFVVTGNGKIKYLTIPTEGLIYRLSLDETYYTVSTPYSTDGRTTIGTQEIQVADKINGLPVKSIDPYGVWGETNLQRFVCPDTLTSFAPSCFISCQNLEEILLPNNNIMEDLPEDATGSLWGAFQGAFSQASNLKRIIGEIDTSKVKNFQSAFSGCSNLEYLPILDMMSCENATGMFDNCRISRFPILKNIKTSIDLSFFEQSGYDMIEDYYYYWNEYLIEKIIPELRKTDSKNYLTINSNWYDNYDSSKYGKNVLKEVFVETVDITDDMKTADALIEEKIPFRTVDSSMGAIYDPNNWNYELYSDNSDWAIYSQTSFYVAANTTITIEPKEGYTWTELANGTDMEQPFYIRLSSSSSPSTSNIYNSTEALFEVDSDGFYTLTPVTLGNYTNNYLVVGYSNELSYQSLYNVLQYFNVKIGTETTMSLIDYLGLKNWEISEHSR